jgi:hypothetical protein
MFFFVQAPKRICPKAFEELQGSSADRRFENVRAVPAEVISMDAERCPKCNAFTVVAGHVTPGLGEMRDTHFCFVPIGTRPLRWKTGVVLRNAFLACSSCGHFWTSLAPNELRDFIEDYGRELAKQHLESLEAERHGLPDCPKAREAGRRVATIDALMLADKQPEATRRYRQLTGTTWDQAIDTICHWRDLKRPQKLALFGWYPKDPPQADDSGMSGHPMRDALLDG